MGYLCGGVLWCGGVVWCGVCGGVLCVVVGVVVWCGVVCVVCVVCVVVGVVVWCECVVRKSCISVWEQ